ncbi:hypothetical protein MARBORIA2_17360 [Methanobrevibacter arboriphilus]|jgi:hypothetical protein|uniref:Uncharacterized protein n=1 Tax=Methanobrevibacter arboriphilus TaxID=39441 RepID=A0ACA8R0L6_METAZ|nr:hypothetical protein [Methanobrevibacter arboriphilus]BBL61011.1 hypothetical protein MarbSA_00510 [Methanobrevibacter arboriphilus]GLI12646.1 hypothetical protein MARBORIA2_17360 [Methanobrevibacter arboriphilus]
MSKILPNTTILFIFTKSNENNEEILFIYKKILLDSWNNENSLYWYINMGKMENLIGYGKKKN